MQTTAMRGDNLLGNPKSQTTAFDFGSEVRIEDGGDSLGRNAGTVVAYFDEDSVIHHGSADLDLSISFDGLHRIDNQVHQSLSQTDRVGLEQRQIGIHLSGDLDLAGSRLRPQQFAHMIDNSG